MTALRDELVELTSDQPAQPGDRLMSVTRRARRIRRTRTLLVAAAVIAVAAPVGIALSAAGSDPRPAIVATAVSDWPDRSQPSDRLVANGAVAQWTSEGARATGFRWLYRGVLESPGAPTLYAAAWVADGKVVTASAFRDALDPNGRPKGKDDKWVLTSIDVARVPSIISLLFFDPQHPRARPDNNRVLLLADPAARTLRWTTSPLPSAPTTAPRSGTLSSTNGVFDAWIGPLTGRLSASVEGLPGDPLPLTFPDAEPLLTLPAPPSTGSGTEVASGGDVAFADEAGLELGDVVLDRPGDIRIRCYGGGTLTVLVDDASVGAVACDLGEHAVQLTGSAGTHQVRLRGDHWQAISWVVVETPR